MHNNKIYAKEWIYKTELTNQALAKELNRLGIDKRRFIADCAEPKSIEELKRAGIHVQECIKGRDSRKFGIQKLKGYKIYYTENSENLKQEYLNYCWELDKNKMPTGDPCDGNDHLLDALRYVVSTRLRTPTITLV